MSEGPTDAPVASEEKQPLRLNELPEEWWDEDATWADDVPLQCGIENPESCESCT